MLPQKQAVCGMVVGIRGLCIADKTLFCRAACTLAAMQVSYAVAFSTI